MADLQLWRCHKQLARPIGNTNIFHSHIDDVAPSDDTSCSPSPGADEIKLQPQPSRSLASFASYLGAHNRTGSPSSRTEWPSIDWFNLTSLNDKNGVYKPDTDLMCTTVMQQVLANPSGDLPAQYNTFLLHLIESYHQSKAAVRELQIKLAEETQCNQTKLDESRGPISSWPLKQAYMSQNLEKSESNTSNSTGPMKKTTATRVRKHSPTVQTPKSSIAFNSSGQKHRQAGKSRTSEHHQLVPSAHRHRGVRTRIIGTESSHDHWLSSPPLHGMELIDGNVSSAESESVENRMLMSASDAFLGLDDDVASCLAGSMRLKCQQGDTVSELSEPLQRTRKEIQKSLALNSIGTLRPDIPIASGKIVTLGKEKIPRLQSQSNKLIGKNDSLSLGSTRALGHRRGFSFLPGDDSTDTLSSSAFRGQDIDSEENPIRPLALQDTKQGEHDESGKSAKDGLSGETVVVSSLQKRFAKSVASSTAKSGVSRNQQRDGSGKNVLTTIISSSSRSSSPTPRTSRNSSAEKDSLREGNSCPRNTQLAVAAARAAKNGSITARTFQRLAGS